jgi:hypothetical protein
MRDFLPRSCLYICAALLWACGDDGPEDEGPTSCYADKIEYDCVQEIDCRMRLGEPPLGGSDPVGACIERGTSEIQNDPTRPAQFLTAYGRCAGLTGCAYRTCASSGAHGYGEAHRAQAMYDCEQKLACETSKGTAICDINNAVSNCVNESIGLLDSLSPEKRTAYEAGYAFCAPQTGCAFVDCFVY